jgi:hypothetical protein
MRSWWMIGVLVSGLLGVGFAAGIAVAPRLRPSAPVVAPAAAPVSAERAPEGRGGQAGQGPDERTARLGMAATTLSRVPQLRPEARPPEVRNAPQRLALQDLPAPVQAVVRQLTMGRHVQKLEFERRQHDGTPYIKAEFELEGMEHEYALDDQGKVLATEFDVALSELPGPISKGIQAALPGVTLLEADRQQIGDSPPIYEVEVVVDGQRRELKVGEDGRIIRQKVR